MPISRPATVTTLDVPGAISSTVATTWRAAISAEPEHALGVVGEDHPPLSVGDIHFQHHPGVVEIPVRVIRREQQAVPADPLDRAGQILGPLGLFHRLGRVPDMLADIVAGLAL